MSAPQKEAHKCPEGVCAAEHDRARERAPATGVLPHKQTRMVLHVLCLLPLRVSHQCVSVGEGVKGQKGRGARGACGRMCCTSAQVQFLVLRCDLKGGCEGDVRYRDPGDVRGGRGGGARGAHLRRRFPHTNRIGMILHVL